MLTLVRKSPWRQTAARSRDRGRDRPILVALEPGAVVVRLKQTRSELRLPWGLVYQLAAQAEADARRRARRPNPGSRRVRRGGLR